MTTDFMISFNKALSNEGVISNNASDKGGFTYKGISRIKHPSWSGWKIIDSIFPSLSLATYSDSIRRRGTEGEVLSGNQQLAQLLQDFYRTNFWNKIQGDNLPSQNIADELFDSSINLGVTAASEFLQRTINILNRNKKLYPDIAVDGQIGNQTIEALNKCYAANGEKLIYNLLNFYQAKRYIEIMERDSTQEIFIGWFNRIEIHSS